MISITCMVWSKLRSVQKMIIRWVSIEFNSAGGRTGKYWGEEEEDGVFAAW